VAFRWNVIADPAEHGRYPVVIRDGITPWEVDLRPLVKAAVLDLIEGRSPSIVSARFHNTLIDVTVELAHSISAARGDMPVVLSGGCFQNALLAEGVLARIDRTSPVYMNQEIPPGDGGLALGQAVIAARVARAGDLSLALQPEAACA
jgi:hydrogenase maturation protein HypF